MIIDQVTIGVQLKSSTGTLPNLVRFTKLDNSLPIRVNVIYDEFNKSSIEPTSLHLVALNNVHVVVQE